MPREIKGYSEDRMADRALEVQYDSFAGANRKENLVVKLMVGNTPYTIRVNAAELAAAILHELDGAARDGHLPIR